MITAPDFKEINGLIEYLKFVPYDVSRKKLYDAAELYKGFNMDDSSSFENCFDTKVYRHYIKNGKQATTVAESLARTLHDHGIHVAMEDFFKQHDPNLCIGIMGGHAQRRTDPMYKQVALISKQLTELGFTMLSGGGPGAMEATHLGAWLAGRTDDEVAAALDILSVAPCFSDDGWLTSALQVMREFPQHVYESLGIPTWLYGHEPTTPFATHIAKFFENSIREDSILTLAYGGIIYTPGSAGTMQEIFQDAVQNHYLSFGFSSPMIFFGKDFWTNEMPAYPLLKDMMMNGRYKNLLLTLTDEPAEVVSELIRFRDKHA